MKKPKLRTIFNIILVLMLFCYISLIWIINIDTLDMLIYFVLYSGVMILRDFIAPKQNKENKSNN